MYCEILMDFKNNVIRFDTIDSTNRFLVSEALQGAPEGTVCVADYQTSGKGRADRIWESPPAGGLLCSVLFRPDIAVSSFYVIPTVVSLAILDALEKVESVLCGIKWPNDIVYGGKKLGGLLSEVVTPGVKSGNVNSALVVGFGINCFWPAGFKAAIDPGIALLPTTLEEITTRVPDKNILLEHILDGIRERYENFLFHWSAASVRSEQTGRDFPRNSAGAEEDASLSSAAGAIAEEYRSRCVTVGQDVRVHFRDGIVKGHASDIDRYGRLLVETEGQTVAVDAADVVHLRSDH